MHNLDKNWPGQFTFYNKSAGTSITSDVNAGHELLTSDAIRRGNKVNPLPWYYDYHHYYYATGSMVQNATGNSYVGVLGSTKPSIDNIVAITTDQQARALSRALDQLLGKLSSADWASSLAEMAANLENPMKQLTDCADHPTMRAARQKANPFKNGRWRVYTRIMSSAWLQLQYMWRPAVTDIFVTIEKLAAMGTGDKGIRVTGRATEECTPAGASFPLRATTSTRAYTTGKISHRCYYDVRMSLNMLATAQNLTSMDPRVIAWNLLPYSFVVDWVYDIGGYLANMEKATMFGPAFKTGYRTLSSLVLCNAISVGSTTNGLWKVTASASMEEIASSRVILTKLPKPTRPAMAADLKSGRMLNLAALLAQKLR